MSIKDRGYQKVTKAQARKCINWCKERLNLRDWDITLKWGPIDDEEDCLGYTYIRTSGPWTFRAFVSVDPESCRNENSNAYVTVCHEMIHVLTVGKCKITPGSDEHVARAFEDFLYVDYCKFAGIEKVKLED